MEDVKEFGFSHLFKENCREGQETTARTTNTSRTQSAYLHIGKILCCMTPDSPFFPLLISACTLQSVKHTVQR